MEQDVIIVGAGAAGLSAAIASAEAGARTLVIEKAQNISNSNTSRAGGNITLARRKETGQGKESLLSPKEIVEEALSLSSGQTDPALVLTWAENITNTVEWLSKLGLKWANSRFVAGESIRCTALGKGAGLSKQLLSIVTGKGVKVLYNTRGIKLLTDANGGVRGIRCETEGGVKDLESRAVILATSGFQGDKAMLSTYIGADFANNIKLTGSTLSTGDGHIMAEEVGAQLVSMNLFHGRMVGKRWVPGSVASPPLGTYSFARDSILVNKQGKRFVDESIHGDSLTCSIAEQPGQEASFIFDEKAKTKNSDDVTQCIQTGLVMKYNTIEDLARGIWVPYKVLRKTLDEFNEAVAKGKSARLDVPRKGRVVNIDTPPFYAVNPVWFGLNCTLGGPKVNRATQVVNKADVPIAGLFACGEMAGGFYSGDFHSTPGGVKYFQGNYGVTTSLSTCVVFGRIAGIEAAKLRQQN